MEDIVKEYIDTKCSIQFLAKNIKKMQWLFLEQLKSWI